MKLASARVTLILVTLFAFFFSVQSSAAKPQEPYLDHIRRGVELHTMGDFDGAIAEYRAAIRLKSKFAMSHFNLGITLAAKGELDASITELRTAIQLAPKNADVHTGLASVLYDKGDVQGAMAECRLAIDLKPKNANAWNTLAWMYATSKDPRFRDPGKALEYAQKAVSLSKAKDFASLDTLAEAYFVNGELDKAIETEEAALKLSPGHALLLKNLENYRNAKEAKK